VAAAASMRVRAATIHLRHVVASALVGFYIEFFLKRKFDHFLSIQTEKSKMPTFMRQIWILYVTVSRKIILKTTGFSQKQLE
jgi:hypothetical protein